MVSNPKQKAGASSRIEPLCDESVDMVAAMLRVLGDPTRLRLIEILNDRGSATVSALAACVPVSQQGVSKQLGVLHRAGVVSRRREGVRVRYELIDFTGWWLVQQLASALAESPSGLAG
jgi:DNA-binding transcriptional ArsR family regulator